MQISFTSKLPIKRYVLLALFACLLSYALFRALFPAMPSVNIEQVEFSPVKQGDVTLFQVVFGSLEPIEQQLITAPAAGKVTHINFKAGQSVQAGDMLITLENPELAQQLEQAQQRLIQLKAQFAAFELEQKQQHLIKQSELNDVDAALEKANLELSINQQLNLKGIASKIELQRAELLVKQLTRKVSFANQQYQQFIAMQGFQLKQQQSQVTQQASQVEQLQNQLLALTVRAPIDANLQQLDIKLGQSLAQGATIAKLASAKQLFALVRIPQHQAEYIKINQPVTVTIGEQTLDAHISRIEAQIKQGFVYADVVLEQALPASAKPNMEISAKITLGQAKNALYVEQLNGFHPFSQQAIYVKQAEYLRQHSIKFGALSDNKLLITHGAEIGDVLAKVNSQQVNNQAMITLKQ